jgi:hypothetical protein
VKRLTPEEETAKFRTALISGPDIRQIDAAGRNAIGTYAYLFETEGVTEVVHVQMHRDPAFGWQPVGGIAAVRAAAVEQLALSREGPASIGAKVEANLSDGRKKAWKRKNGTVMKVQECIDNYTGNQQNEIHEITRQGKLIRKMRKPSKRTDIIRKIKKECGIGRSYIYQLEKTGQIAFPKGARIGGG